MAEAMVRSMNLQARRYPLVARGQLTAAEWILSGHYPPMYLTRTGIRSTDSRHRTLWEPHIARYLKHYNSGCLQFTWSGARRF